MDPPSTKRRKINFTDSSIPTEQAFPSSSHFTPNSCPYDVFLSFRGVDTRDTFTGHLRSSLVRKGIRTFIDDEELREGEEISSPLLKAIEGSKISIVIFSENYASSKWCLDELVKILECKESPKQQQLVWPVFYKVDPSVVRYQTGKYKVALAKHERRLKDNMDKVQRWRTALTHAANLKGWTFSNGHEANFIDQIVEDISTKISKCTYLNVANYPVGIESRVRDMFELLDVGGSDVCMVGIWGIGGIGKTTIAKAVYNLIAHKFEGCCFLENVRADSVPHQGLVRLQNNILYEILGGRKMKLTNADRGIQVMKERLGSKRVLLVLDDVNELNQLDKLAGALDWFGCGSRIIITTRDKRLLIAHKVYPIYTAKALDNDEARNLLILTAFKDNRNPDEYVQFPIDTAVLYAHGLPLVVNILGSLLCGKSINQWHAALDSYKRFPNSNIQQVLETSYSALEDPLKEAFLDIACFLKGKPKEYVMQALEGSYLNPVHAIEVLEEKALINIDKYGLIWMHDLLEEMGKEIVRKESPNDAGRRSRIWFHEDVYRVLTENTGSKKVKGIRVELPREDEICLSAKCFKKMKNLQLFININARFSGEVKYLPNQLKFLDWPGFPAQSLPSDFNPQKLVKLNMPNSRISRLGQGLKNLHNLKSLSFEHCKFLTEVPDLSGMFPNLERLNLRCCTSLTELHPSVGFLDKLVHFNLRDCSNLKMFPRIVNMRSLEDIDLSGCKRLRNFPEIVGRIESLTHMYVSGTAIKEVPSSIGYHLFNLRSLNLENSENLTNLPLSIYELQELLNLQLTGCPKLVLTPISNRVRYYEGPAPTSHSTISHYGKAISSRESDGDDDVQDKLSFPSLIYFLGGGCFSSDCDFLVTLGCASTLEMLDLSESNFVSLPACIRTFINLNYLNLKGCKRLQEVPELPPNLEMLSVRGCVSLERISKLSNILKREEWQMFEWLDLTDCWRLCDNLVQEAEKEGLLVNDDSHQMEANLFSLFLSSQKSEFGVVLPGSHEIPKWFSSQIDFKANGPFFEFHIQVLPNFKWENSGLALCVATEEKLEWRFEILINEVQVENKLDDRGSVYKADSACVWLLYIPFDGIDMQPFRYKRPLPPFQCRVTISLDVAPNEVGLKSCGVHPVMPPNEESMKLYQALRIESDW
ncbi:TMV resistance protein N-like isoform X2 [Rosa chinensis]|uniref:TMV resistance protein N-like isoform X2 n=1 Tax=Rosa chinensis TaxID=74649 RepID=UPI001AD92D1D|nr:TMV resistance protein N-like isoform X2 [Rosa chinensis]